MFTTWVLMFIYRLNQIFIILALILSGDTSEWYPTTHLRGFASEPTLRGFSQEINRLKNRIIEKILESL